MRPHALWLTAFGLAVAACKSDSVTAPADVDPTTITFAAALAVDFSTMTKTASGLWYKDVAVGGGAAVTDGARVVVKYRGYLADGTDFTYVDPMRDSAPYTIGSRATIAGFNEGLVGMRVGGKRRLVIRPLLGYGSTTIGIIPASSVLVFDVELVSVAIQ